jgi:hypothetical protein
MSVVSKYKTSRKYFCRLAIRVGADVEARRHHGTSGLFVDEATWNMYDITIRMYDALRDIHFLVSFDRQANRHE